MTSPEPGFKFVVTQNWPAFYGYYDLLRRVWVHEIWHEDRIERFFSLTLTGELFEDND